MLPHPSARPAAIAPVSLRQVRADDAAGILDLVQSLSPTDRRNRFHCAITTLSDAALARMTQVDQQQHVALLAIDPASGAVVADARWVADAHGVAAEFALMVRPAWRRRGLGSRCIFELRRAAAERSVRCLYGSVLAGNMPMLALMLHTGFECLPDSPDDEIVIARSSIEARAPALWPAGWFSARARAPALRVAWRTPRAST